MKNNNQKMFLRFIDDDDERSLTVYGEHFSLVSLVRCLVDCCPVIVTGSVIKDIEDGDNPL